MTNDITYWYDLELNFQRAKRRLEELQESVKQSAWSYREKRQAEVEYLSSFRRLMDKLRGNTERLEEIQQQIREAKAHHEHQKRELESHKLVFEALEKELQTIPPWEVRRDQAQADPEDTRYLAQRERELCTEMLNPLLAKTLEALEAYRQQLRGGNSDRIISVQELHEVGTAHIEPARKCLCLLNRLRSAMEVLEQSMEIGAYFENPTGYIESAAARHSRLDRINSAISQTEAIQRLLK